MVGSVAQEIHDGLRVVGFSVEVKRATRQS
jgi:hypothetical protein